MLIVLGVGADWYGGRFGRRFTTWVWAVAIRRRHRPGRAEGAAGQLIGRGITFIVIGLIVVVGAQFVASSTDEPADVETVPPADRPRAGTDERRT